MTGIGVGVIGIRRNRGFSIKPASLDDITGLVIGVFSSRRSQRCVIHAVLQEMSGIPDTDHATLDRWQLPLLRQSTAP